MMVAGWQLNCGRLAHVQPTRSKSRLFGTLRDGAVAKRVPSLNPYGTPWLHTLTVVPTVINLQPLIANCKPFNPLFLAMAQKRFIGLWLWNCRTQLQCDT
jgi:hypothetical protein